MSGYAAPVGLIKVAFYPELPGGRYYSNAHGMVWTLTDGQEKRIKKFKYVSEVDTVGLSGSIVIAEFADLAEAAREAPKLEAKIVRLLERTTKEQP